MSLDEFRALSSSEMEEHLLSVTALCYDGAPKSLARKVELYIQRIRNERSR